MHWNEMTLEQKQNLYESYVNDIIYEFGDNAKYMTFKEYDKDNEWM